MGFSLRPLVNLGPARDPVLGLSNTVSLSVSNSGSVAVSPSVSAGVGATLRMFKPTRRYFEGINGVRCAIGLR